uniref:non-specific serine/threonine protein kinase n=1 Tax=Parastrongyloides trichosuri TaxID=131310 RepID=A0A0N4Z8S0_PARTI
MSNEEGPAKLEIGKTIGRFVITGKIGEGACGAVYICKEKSTNKEAALKAELISEYGNGLKLEVQILRRLKGKRHVAQLISCGKNEVYCYMVITLLGKSLSYYMHTYRLRFTLSTVLRVAIQTLYGLKQIHEVGILHRDMKPANMTIGRYGIERRIIHIIDFGLSREFTIVDNGKLRIRKPRVKCLFRGTVKYCSTNALERKEQGRGDDLVSLFYICGEFRKSLPWARARSKEEVYRIKKQLPDEVLFPDSQELVQLLGYAKGLNYFERPDYHFVYKKLRDAMKKGGYKFSEPYDWELYECFNKQPSMPTMELKPVETIHTQKTQEFKLPYDQYFEIVQYSDKFFEDHLHENKFKENELGF